jgi:hypothetical protein
MVIEVPFEFQFGHWVSSNNCDVVSSIKCSLHFLLHCSMWVSVFRSYDFSFIKCVTLQSGYTTDEMSSQVANTHYTRSEVLTAVSIKITII